MTEQSIIGARASVMVYDDNQKKWVPSGTSSGLSKVQIYHHQQNNTFRVVGRKLQDHEVVINCSILKGLKYNQATATFHQWRDSKYVYGLNFSSQNDAEAFARAMMHALDVLSGRVPNNPGQPMNGNSYEEDMGYRTMTSEDAAILRQQQQITGQVTPSAQTPTSQTNQNNIPQSPPTPQQGHHRTSSAPPAPQPQQQMLQQQQQQQQQALYGHTGNGPTQNGGMQQQQQQPTQQMQQPPPAPGQTQYHAPQQLQQQQQPQQPSQHQQQQQHSIYASQQMVNAAGYPPQPNQSTPAPTENSGSSTPSGGSGNYGTIGRSTNGMASMMDEMAKTLARRRAQAEKKEPEPEPEVKQRPWEKSNTLPHKLGNSNSSNSNANSNNTSNSGGESPRPMRKRFGSASEETILKVMKAVNKIYVFTCTTNNKYNICNNYQQVNGDSLSVALSGSDLEQLKAEIVREMKQELQKVKQEIIDAIKSEFNRR
ncbi:Protein enabled [Lucilia cuprina]|nr:Protein enabled [Lucilia cuprina]